MAGPDSGPGGTRLRIGVSDRLAAALLVRNHPQDVEEAIEILTRVRTEAASEPMYTDAGGAATLATARLRRWMHTRSGRDEKMARSAYAEAFATAIIRYPLTAEQIASQWGAWAWSEGWWAEAGEAYSQALRALHLAVRRQASRSHRDLIVRKAPGVAAMAAFGLARAGPARPPWSPWRRAGRSCCPRGSTGRRSTIRASRVWLDHRKPDVISTSPTR